MILKLPAQCRKAGLDWWLRPIIPTTGGASLSYLVKLRLKNKRGLRIWLRAEHLPNKCEILGSLLSSAIKPKPEPSAYFNPLGSDRRDPETRSPDLCKVEIQARISQIPNLDNHVDSSSGPASVCPQFPLF